VTTVHISLGRDDGTDQTAAKGVVEWEPTTRREDGTMVILERGFVAPLVDGEATVTVDPSGLTWCWRVTERTDSGGTVRYVSVPDSATTVEYVDLPDVDPTTLVEWTPADPEAAYLAGVKAALDAKALSDMSTYAPLAAVGIVTITLPASPVVGQAVSFLADSTSVIPAGVTWDSGGEPTISAGRLLLTFVWSGDDWVGTYGLPFAAPPAAPDTTAPTAGTLSVTAFDHDSIDLSVAGAADETALAAAPYAYSSDNGVTWTAYQAGATYAFSGLTAETSYTLRHKVKDAAGNETVGTAITQTTDAVPADTTPPTAGTLAGSAITSSGFTLTVTGAADETALHATPYAFSTDNGATYTAYQSSPTYSATGLTAETAYQCKHRVRDAAGNVSEGTAITVTTSSAVITDTFNRTNSATTLGTTETGETWAVTSGSVWGITSNTAYRVSPATSARHAATVEVSSADMVVSATAPSPGTLTYPGVTGRFTNIDNCYLLWFQSDTSSYWVMRRIAGVQTGLGSVSASAGLAFSLSLKEEAGGTRVIGKVAGTEFYNELDTTAGRPTGTRAGIFTYVGGTAAKLDDFSAQAI